MTSDNGNTTVPVSPANAEGPFTLALDIGGTGLKAAVLDRDGNMITDRARVDTPYPCPPPVMLNALGHLVGGMPSYDRISAGFPGVVRDGHVITAPHFGNKVWAQFNLAQALEDALKKPARVINDADMQGLAVIKGEGLELVVTLGTGVGTALFRQGKLMPHLELAQHPIWKGKTYNEFVGDAVLKAKGKKKWNRRVRYMMDVLNTLLNYDKVYIGGGNSAKIKFPLDPNMELVSNTAGLIGGIVVWQHELEETHIPA